jgi:hypothetical protein
MKVASAALHPLFLFLMGFVALAGFVTAALLVGMLALGPRPVSIADDSLRVPATSSSAQDLARVVAISIYAPDRLAAAGPWPFESATPGSERAPGKTRHDRLSAPEGWTYDASGQVQ